MGFILINYYSKFMKQLWSQLSVVSKNGDSAVSFIHEDTPNLTVTSDVKLPNLKNLTLKPEVPNKKVIKLCIPQTRAIDDMDHDENPARHT